jgi:hypothetical protein
LKKKKSFEGSNSLPDIIVIQNYVFDTDKLLRNNNKENFKVEGGTITVIADKAGEEQTVHLKKQFDSPVVIQKPMTNPGGDPGHIRISNVQQSYFQTRVEEWAGEDDINHFPVSASFLVLEEGNYKLENGAQIEVGKLQTNHSWKHQKFKKSFNKTPVVFTQSQTRNGGDAITTRNTDISKEGFKTKLQEGEAKGAHTEEEIGYIAIEPSQGNLGDLYYKADRTGNSFTHKYNTINYDGYYPSGVIIDMQTTNGGNTADLRRKENFGKKTEVKIEEEKSRDNETSHTEEVLGWLAWY